MKNRSSKKWLKVTMTLFGILLIGLVAFGSYFYSKKGTVNRYLEARSQTSGPVFENIKEYLIWDDTNEKITSDQARFAYFKRLSKGEKAKLEEQILSADAQDEWYLKNVGYKFLVFPDYRIAIKPKTLTLKTNVPKVDLLLNNKKVATSDSEDYSVTLKRLPVSDYIASLKGLYKGREIEVSKVYDGKDTTLDLTVTFKNFTVTSNAKDWELYFDDSRIGSLTDGKYEVKDYPLTGTAKAYVKKAFPDGDLVSEKKLLLTIDENSELNLNVAHLLDNQKAGEYLLSAFDQLMIYASYRQDPANVSDVFENGAQNDFYKGLKESVQSKLVNDSRKASAFAIPNVVLNNLTQVGKESYVVDFSATYDYTYNKETDPKKNTSGHIIQELSGKLPLKKSGDKYIVSQSGLKNISVTSEKNQLKEPPKKVVDKVPAEIVGTWKGEKDGNKYSLSFAADGTVTQTIDFKDEKQAQVKKSAKVTSSEEKAAGLYRFSPEGGTDVSTFVVPAGIGGDGVKYEYGVQLNGNKLTSVIWQTGVKDQFDYSKPLPGMELTKE